LPQRLDQAVDEAAEVIDLELERQKRKPQVTEQEEGDTPLGGFIRIQSSHIEDSSNHDDDPDPAA
jgi:hypothetical protein